MFFFAADRLCQEQHVAAWSRALLISSGEQVSNFEYPGRSQTSSHVYTYIYRPGLCVFIGFNGLKAAVAVAVAVSVGKYSTKNKLKLVQVNSIPGYHISNCISISKAKSGSCECCNS